MKIGIFYLLSRQVGDWTLEKYRRRDYSPLEKRRKYDPNGKLVIEQRIAANAPGAIYKRTAFRFNIVNGTTKQKTAIFVKLFSAIRLQTMENTSKSDTSVENWHIEV